MQLFRAETPEEHLKAGIEVGKIDKMRPWLERRCCMSLTRSDHLMEQYLGPLRKKHNANSVDFLFTSVFRKSTIAFLLMVLCVCFFCSVLFVFAFALLVSLVCLLFSIFFCTCVS